MKQWENLATNKTISKRRVPTIEGGKGGMIPSSPQVSGRGTKIGKRKRDWELWFPRAEGVWGGGRALGTSTWDGEKKIIPKN